MTSRPRRQREPDSRVGPGGIEPCVWSMRNMGPPRIERIGYFKALGNCVFLEDISPVGYELLRVSMTCCVPDTCASDARVGMQVPVGGRACARTINTTYMCQVRVAVTCEVYEFAGTFKKSCFLEFLLLKNDTPIC